MKSITACFLFLAFTFTTYSQYYGKVEYKTFLSFDNNIEYQSSLLFTHNNSLFLYKVKGDGIYENADIPDKINFINIDTTTNIIFINKNKKLLYESQNPGKNEYFSYEDIPQLKWEFLSQTKVFNTITCSLAKTNFRGRIYYAWYAPAIPVSYGPWKLQGLPGLILEAYDETKEVIFEFASIHIPFKYDFSIVENRINTSSKVCLLEHVKKQKNNLDDFAKKITTKLPRGASVEITKIKRTGIELNYNDILNDKQ